MSLSFPICKEETQKKKKKKNNGFLREPFGAKLEGHYSSVRVDLRQVGAAEGHKENGRRGRF